MKYPKPDTPAVTVTGARTDPELVKFPMTLMESRLMTTELRPYPLVLKAWIKTDPGTKGGGVTTTVHPAVGLA